MNKRSLKEEKIKNMFDHISCKYDLINHILSFGIDFFWRKKIIHLLDKFNKVKKIENILDLATGTGDLAILLANKFDDACIIGLDPSKKMLQIAQKKIENNFLEKKIKLIQGYSQHIPFKNETFDAVTIAFGIRNFQYIHLSIREIYRILKPLGILGILEFSNPSNYWIKKIYYFYSHFIMNKIGNFLSNNHFAYNYLKESILSFSYCGKKMSKLLKYHKFNTIYIRKLTFEIVSIYLSIKIY
ncbi:ubiquinone/menaquinone biosynthesis methyltransferase [Blattabacterium sp. (Blattella germanica) str. Bge]|uniref:bifunctional demethylmenaquinone methyltransferase/2-methoxy-6-polyprenyl-1,4-benzoquinol methylase UbiE n=1 Tax=Blattabacterium sp. (Blattella germanica) TaxID=624186 RepID=UPI0001BB60C3|nr:bifunctional demethylmenaquinone methyltransferase/2-methoxy-6-polyprenyl-1,4-benzoquinol methylase UbiE [Blattabacterium sp. (Blattella germanica)]ACY40141.1 ubiquinone/menaquinone biosynthesis methyltransferase [Blattabacterium sp. (Blattella germanica) str. Bge]